MKKLIFLLFQFLLFAQLSFAASWYVNCAESNGGDGSIGTPYDDIQSAVNVATRGDTFYLADSAPCVLPTSTPINYSTGFTNTGSAAIKYISYHVNGGTLTIQRPDEPTARYAAVIDINGNNSAQASSLVRTSWTNIRFINTGNRSLYLNELSGCFGCEFSGSFTVAVEFTGSDGSVLAGSYIHDGLTPYWNIDLGGNNHVIANYFDNNTGTQIRAGGYRGRVSSNIFKLNHANTAIQTENGYGEFSANTFISNGTASAVGLDIVTGDTYPTAIVTNNLFYNFDGASAKPIKNANPYGIGTLGHNAYYDCNSSDSPSFIVNDLTANDVIGTGDPFVSSSTNNFAVTGSDAEGAGLGGYGSSVDIGAVQGASTGGGGGTIINRIFMVGE